MAVTRPHREDECRITMKVLTRVIRLPWNSHRVPQPTHQHTIIVHTAHCLSHHASMLPRTSSSDLAILCFISNPNTPLGECQVGSKPIINSFFLSFLSPLISAFLLSLYYIMDWFACQPDLSLMVILDLYHCIGEII